MFTNFKTVKKNKIKFRLFSESGAGISLIEIIVVIFIIALFSMLAVSDFPRIQRQFALSKVTYKLDQDLRKTEDLALSGVPIKDKNGIAIKAKGYGIYIPIVPTTQYIIYADVDGIQTYNGGGLSCTSQLYAETPETADCVMETIDISQANPNLNIKSINNIISGTTTSINFSPPNPIINIANISPGNSKIEINLGLTNDNSVTRIVQVYTSGLINVQ